jgi:flagellar hook-associated protein 1
MNFGGLLSIGRSGLNAAQAQISTASQNVTNAQTPGYSRQRVLLKPNWPEQLPQGTFGTGVLIDGVERMRDELLDASFRRDTQGASYGEERRDALQAVENVLGEPSDTGLASSLEQFWSAWSDLSTNPDSSAARGVVRQRGSQVAAQLNTFGDQIAQEQAVTRSRLLETVEKVNALSQQVADINARIVAAEASGHQSPDMRDQRDLKVDELAALVGATAYPQADGSVNVNIGGESIVDGADFKPLRVQSPSSDPTKLGIARGTSAENMYQIGGQVAGILDTYNTINPSALTKLDGVAAAIIATTNTVHRTGFIGATSAGNFFDSSRTTARTIRIDPAISASVNNIAASGIANESSDNSVAISLAQLRDTLTTVNGATASLNDGYRTVVTDIATAVNSANGTATAARTLATLTNTRRESIKGVSIDEEMVNLMKYQQSYAAAARLITVVDEMSQTLINMAR